LGAHSGWGVAAYPRYGIGAGGFVRGGEEPERRQGEIMLVLKKPLFAKYLLPQGATGNPSAARERREESQEKLLQEKHRANCIICSPRWGKRTFTREKEGNGPKEKEKKKTSLLFVK